ncbi:response regulator [Aestuariimicrobium sp. Y1814]|uniref:response regulator n=1 Tax=Aestuariimicrobium sp. Y1814 TaxID=3418742 RepID=UPI003DA704C7
MNPSTNLDAGARATRLVLVDDDALVRAGLKLILGGTDEFEIVAEGSDGDEVLALVDAHHPDIVLLDIRMARKNGLDAAGELLARPQPPKVIMLTTFDADDLVMRALTVGASGFLLKDTAPERMVESIRQVAAGEQSLSPSVTAQVIAAATRGFAGSRRNQARKDLERLTERELEVARAIADGLTNPDIARARYMSVATVKAHVTSIFDKLGVNNRVQVAIRFHDAQLD